MASNTPTPLATLAGVVERMSRGVLRFAKRVPVRPGSRRHRADKDEDEVVIAGTINGYLVLRNESGIACANDEAGLVALWNARDALLACVQAGDALPLRHSDGCERFRVLGDPMGSCSMGPDGAKITARPWICNCGVEAWRQARAALDAAVAVS